MRTSVLVVLALVAIACGPPSAEDLVNEILLVRTDFDVQLTSWVPRDEGGADPHLYLDVTILKETDESLRYLTVMVEQQDELGNTLSETRVALDVSNVERGYPQNVGVAVRPLMPNVEGVRLYLEPNPPQDAWSEFPELEAVRPRG
jgi:hypothetical protein